MEGVVDEVVDGLADPIRVEVPLDGHRDVQSQCDVAGLRRCLRTINRGAQKVAHVSGLAAEASAAVGAGQQQEVLCQPGQPIGLPDRGGDRVRQLRPRPSGTRRQLEFGAEDGERAPATRGRRRPRSRASRSSASWSRASRSFIVWANAPISSPVVGTSMAVPRSCSLISATCRRMRSTGLRAAEASSQAPAAAINTANGPPRRAARVTRLTAASLASTDAPTVITHGPPGRATG